MVQEIRKLQSNQALIYALQTDKSLINIMYLEMYKMCYRSQVPCSF